MIIVHVTLYVQRLLKSRVHQEDCKKEVWCQCLVFWVPEVVYLSGSILNRKSVRKSPSGLPGKRGSDNNMRKETCALPVGCISDHMKVWWCVVFKTVTGYGNIKYCKSGYSCNIIRSFIHSQNDREKKELKM